MVTKYENSEYLLILMKLDESGNKIGVELEV